MKTAKYAKYAKRIICFLFGHDCEPTGRHGILLTEHHCHRCDRLYVSHSDHGSFLVQANDGSDQIFKRHPSAEFCNDAESITVLTAFTNEIAIGEDGWAQIAPFGDFPGMALIADGKGGFRKERAIQRMDQAAVSQMVNEYQKGRKGLTRFVTSRPIYLGHPDAPGATGAKYPDKNPKGVFANLAIRPDGFFGEPILTQEGEALVASRKVTALSGRWDAEFVCDETQKDGSKIKIYRPMRFISAGLTDRPNLPVQLLNEADSEDQKAKTIKDQMNKTTVLALFASLGIMNKGAAFANDASDEEVSEGLKQLGEKAKTATTLATEKATLANEKATLEGSLQAEKGKVITLTTEKATLATERDSLKTQFANERKGRIADLLDGATKGGLITAAERPTWETRLGNETTFANEAEALKALKPKVKTESITLQRGDRKVEISNAADRRDMVADLVNEEMTTGKIGYDAAYGRVQKKYPQLFEAMEQPEIRKGGPKKAI